jgi:hypothetical protein
MNIPPKCRSTGSRLRHLPLHLKHGASKTHQLNSCSPTSRNGRRRRSARPTPRKDGEQRAGSANWSRLVFAAMGNPFPPVLARMVALWNGEDIDPVSIFARGCRMNDGESTYEPEEVLPWIANLRAAFADLHFEVAGWFAADHRYVVRFKATGTHTGSFNTEIGEAEATGERFTVHGIEVFEVDADRIVGVWEAWDWRNLYASLGARFSKIA